MTVKELFEVTNTRFIYPDVTIIDYAEACNIETFKYPQYGINYIDKMLSKFGNRLIVPLGVTFGTDKFGVNYIVVEVK